MDNKIKDGLKEISYHFGIRGYNFSNLRGIRKCYHDFTKLQERMY